ncbi:bifunctional lytic transglycosylase/C40 family peptidase [Kitasatospora sp. GAS204B]|uniref:C40 family peptidase n=1 Tax=unclassified Kitasatospora TaxID=2633591 RepID=UPI002476E238|nr:bifunctional lytic transglycosylase/C40 family peptidase [Kitasatospora sp. GAS204B]MDH6118252.1 cell wall-associated NlpC family hydrolase [Kitasatospora sp. GAS204B]
MVLRKGGRAAIAGGAVAFGFLLLVGVGTYAAGGTVQAGGSGLALAPGTVPAAYQGLIQQAGGKCPQISPPMLAAQLYQESGFDPSARSGAGALGLAQFLPSTWAIYGVDGDGDGKVDIWNPADAIASAANYDCALAKDTANVPGDPQANLLAAYNAGPYAVISAGGVPGYTETQGYVRSIKALEASFTAPTSTVAVSPQASGAIYFAQTKLGTPYLWGGDGLASQNYEFDCSGLTVAAYASVGITLPRVANDQWYAGPHPSRDQLRPGDLVFFATDLSDPRTIHHVGIYVGGGYMINAPHTGAVIRYDSIDQKEYIGATRVTQDGAAAVPVRDNNGNGNITGGSDPGANGPAQSTATPTTPPPGAPASNPAPPAAAAALPTGASTTRPGKAA